MRYSYSLMFLSITFALSFTLTSYSTNNKEKYRVTIELPRIPHDHSADDSTESEHDSISSVEQQKTIEKSKRCSWVSGKDFLMHVLVSCLALSAAPDITSIQASNTMNNASSPVTMHPYIFKNGTLVPPILEERPDCSYRPYKPLAYLSYCAQGECLCTDDRECYCIVEDCDSTGDYTKSCNALRLGLIAGLSVKATTILSYLIYQSAQCGHFVYTKVTKAHR